jgi:peptidyl-prolyl cis-trans isomerase C
VRLSRRSPLLLAAVVAACSGSTQAPRGGPSASPSGVLPPIDRVTPLPNPLPNVSARVNGREIPLAYVEIIAQRILTSRDKEKDRPFAYRQATQQLIVRELLLEEAVARKVKADDGKVEQAYNEARIPYKDEDAWKVFLANQGLTVEAFKAEIRTQLTVEALLDQEASHAPSDVSDQEAQAFYQANPSLFESGERLRASHILRRVPEGATPSQKEAVREEVKRLLARIRKGEDFAKIAREASQDAGSAGKGGTLGDFSRGQMTPAFEQAAFALKPGETSDVVETPFGFHVIQLHERLPSQRVAFEAGKAGIKQHIVAARRQQYIERLVAFLRAKARIETYL